MCILFILFIQLFHIASKMYLYFPNASDKDKSPVVGEQMKCSGPKFVDICKLTCAVCLLIGLRLSLRIETSSRP